MPQMAPLLWFNLFFMFCATFLVFLIVNFFIKVPSRISSTPQLPQPSQMTWKW